jgi:hypothetical protein
MKRHSLALALITAMLVTCVALPENNLAQGIGPAPATPESECVQVEDESDCLPTAPESDRIDLATPAFSNPTAITNPLFPIGELAQVILLGTEAGESLRVEVTLLPETRTVEWNNQEVEVLVSQYIANADDEVVEVALDFYAQADDGSVWYFGEDVFNYKDGDMVDMDGTWLAGEDGPPGMIMPADPQVGDVYRPENIPGFVFEEVTVVAVDQTVDGPKGPVEGAIIVQELQMDGATEEKTFAPGFGEFSALTEDEDIIVALAVPVGAPTTALPGDLETMSNLASGIFAAVPGANWETIAATTLTLVDTWEAQPEGTLPPVIAAQMDTAVETLVEAVDTESADDARQASLDVAGAALDLHLLYRSLPEVDLDRIAFAADQLRVDAAAGEDGAVKADVVMIESIWDRVGHTVAPETAEAINAHIGDLRDAADAGDLDTASDLAAELQTLLANP